MSTKKMTLNPCINTNLSDYLYNELYKIITTPQQTLNKDDRLIINIPGHFIASNNSDEPILLGKNELGEKVFLGNKEQMIIIPETGIPFEIVDISFNPSYGKQQK